MRTTTIHRLIAGAAFAGLIASAGAAAAQTTPAAPAAAPRAAAPAQPSVPNGPAIPGVCVFWQDAALATSAVGKFVDQRLNQLKTQIEAELNAERTALLNDEKTLEGQRAGLAGDVFEQRALALRQREQAFARKVDLRQRELEVTRQKALSRIVTEFNPLLTQVYGQRGCSLLLDRNAVFGANPSMEITPDVVKLLDAKITQFQFDRERLDQQQAAAATAPTAAAAQPRKQ